MDGANRLTAIADIGVPTLVAFLSMGEGRSVQINVPLFAQAKLKYYNGKAKPKMEELPKN